MSTENTAQGHTTVKEEEAIMNNWHSNDSGSYHSPEHEFGHLLENRGTQKGAPVDIVLPVMRHLPYIHDWSIDWGS
jgi:hypothetical protein